MLSAFRLEVAENIALPGYYAASDDNFFADVSGQHRPAQRPVQWVQMLFARDKAAGAWHWSPNLT